MRCCSAPGLFASADGSNRLGVSSTIQLGYYITQQVGIVGSGVLRLARQQRAADAVRGIATRSRSQGYPVAAGPMHLGLFGGGGGAARFEDGVVGGNDGGWAVIGGALGQLDINTRLALTARLGETYAHGEGMTDVLLGLSVY